MERETEGFPLAVVVLAARRICGTALIGNLCSGSPAEGGVDANCCAAGQNTDNTILSTGCHAVARLQRTLTVGPLLFLSIYPTWLAFPETLGATQFSLSKCLFLCE